MTRPAVRIALGFVAALVAALALYPEFAGDPHSNDFTAYWAAGRLTLDGGNPYGAADLLRVERGIGWRPDAPLMLWNPPWSLTTMMAFGAVPFPLSRALWLVAQLVVTLGCGLSLWNSYRGPRRLEPWAVVLTVAFVPLWLSLKYGQIGPLCLLGLTGFLLLQAARRDYLAGAVLSLAALKPHLVYLVWPVVLVWAVGTGRWRVLAGLGFAGLALATIPAVVNPHVYADYLAMVREPPPPELAGLFITREDSPTLGWQLRLLTDKDWFALQYVPSAMGLGWLAWYGWRRRRNWDWADRLPLLVLVSICTAAYGAWPADSLLLLPALMAVAARLAERGDRRDIVLALAALLTLSLATVAVERMPTTERYVWIPPAYLGLYVRLRSRPAPV